MGAMNSLRWALVVASCGLSAGVVAQTADPKDKDAQQAPAPAAAPPSKPQAKPVAPAKSPAVPAAAPQGLPAAPAAQGVAQAQAALPQGMPDAYKLNLLIRTTVIAVNQANKTGNYSVLRDLAAPGFQASNNSAQLAEIFGDLRKRNLDLSPVLFYQPKFTSRPVLLPNGMMRVVGLFPSRPQQVNFDLVFEQIQGDWRIYGISIGTRLAPPPGPEANAPDAAGVPVTEGTATGGAMPAAAVSTAKPAAQGAGAAPSGAVADKGGGAGAAPPKAVGKDAPVAAKPVSPAPVDKQGLGAPATAP
jgi:hypothetical protein